MLGDIKKVITRLASNTHPVLGSKNADNFKVGKGHFYMTEEERMRACVCVRVCVCMSVRVCRDVCESSSAAVCCLSLIRASALCALLHRQWPRL